MREAPCQQSNAQNSPSEASTVCVPRSYRCLSWIYKGRGTRDQIANICWIIEKAREFHKNMYFCFIDYTKAFVWIITNYGKFLRDGNTRLSYLPHEKSIYRSRSNRTRHGTMDWFKIGKVYIKPIYCHPTYLTYMQSIS